jgi:hypothetical protein
MADVLTIPTLSDGTIEYTQLTELDGTSFKLIFSFNTQDGFWYLSIRLASDVQIVGGEGLRLVAGGWPIRRVYDQNRPLGELYVLSEDGTDPGLTDLGESAFLEYIPLELMEELF